LRSSRGQCHGVAEAIPDKRTNEHMKRMEYHRRLAAAAGLVVTMGASVFGQDYGSKPSWSGIYPHLAYYNDENECGTGAVVPWADRLWIVTYAPHKPRGSTDKLYEITTDLALTARPESVGGTPANRLIHRESKQLFIGPHAIDADRNVRTIPYSKMLGRPTGTARHLTDPRGKVYYASMEEGFYEVDVRTLAVNRLYADTHESAEGLPLADLPGYHGKGLYSGQGVLVYANNGEKSEEAMKKPFIDSGVLAEWNGTAWKVVRRNQFTEVTGPGGISGNPNPLTDPIWTIGWDNKSLILMVRENGTWHPYRLPKTSHSYDGAHGWNTEWPRIRNIGGDDFLMTMHGMFWRFPKTFSVANSVGISPRSSYLKVVGDFAKWGDHIAFGCDDSAKSEFSNKRRAKGAIPGPQSHSNLWFVKPDQLDQFGPAIGRGAVWLRQRLLSGAISEPMLFSGFERRGLHLTHKGLGPVEIDIEIDKNGDGNWIKQRTVRLTARAYKWIGFAKEEKGEWIRLRAADEIISGTAIFEFSNSDDRPDQMDPIFHGLATTDDREVTGGVIRSQAENKRTLHYAALSSTVGGPQDLGYYELDGDLKLKRVEDQKSHTWLKENVVIPEGVLAADNASIIFTNDAGKRYRLPKNDLDYDGPGSLGPERVDREVCTERDLFSAGGTFYELPANNAGGFRRCRPVATHHLRIKDYCSYRGMLVLSGITKTFPADNRHIIRSDDGKTALWVGAIDDVWKLGKPRGVGGPWRETPIVAGRPSDPYLMNGYDKKSMTLTHDIKRRVMFYIQVDLTGEGYWDNYARYEVRRDEKFEVTFPEGYSAYWLRVTTDRDCKATCNLIYE
jgi:hypothetical protein